MGERKFRTSSKPKSHSSTSRKMASPSPGVSNLTALLENASTGTTTLTRCSAATLNRLRQLNDAEWVTLFTPFVPHPPATSLAKNMDPFEPLGRALARHVRHVPYRMDHGMTETHADFLSSAGAVMVVICAAENVVSNYSQAFEMQARFARDTIKKVTEDRTLVGVPVVVLLIASGTRRQAYEEALKDVPALFTCDNYSENALANAVRVIFGS